MFVWHWSTSSNFTCQLILLSIDRLRSSNHATSAFNGRTNRRMEKSPRKFHDYTDLYRSIHRSLEYPLLVLPTPYVEGLSISTNIYRRFYETFSFSSSWGLLHYLYSHPDHHLTLLFRKIPLQSSLIEREGVGFDDIHCVFLAIRLLVGFENYR